MANEYTGGGAYQPGPARKKPKAKKKPAAKSAYKGVDYKLKPKPGGSRQEDMGRNPYKAPGGKRQEDMARKPDGRRQEDMGRRSAPKATAKYLGSAARYAVAYANPKSRPSSMGGKRQEDMARRKPAPRQEDMGRGMAQKAPKPGRAAPKPPSRGLFPSLPRRPKPKTDLRRDLRDMNPGKKRTPVKPRGNPNSRYLAKPLKGFGNVSKRPEDMARRRSNPRPQG